ncbi:hypothetical protein F5X96DRAFT_693371 [Biscogniauxia mediterranea]|nr:hypothetical protein F5X96DRAFT_693371 [Biscogniauxia mediterranea]
MSTNQNEKGFELSSRHSPAPGSHRPTHQASHSGAAAAASKLAHSSTTTTAATASQQPTPQRPSPAPSTSPAQQPGRTTSGWNPRLRRQHPALSSTPAPAPAATSTPAPAPTPGFAPKKPPAPRNHYHHYHHHHNHHHNHNHNHRKNQNQNQTSHESRGGAGGGGGGGPGSFRVVDKIRFDRPHLPVDRAEMRADAARLGLTVGLRHSRWAPAAAAASGSGSGEGEAEVEGKVERKEERKEEEEEEKEEEKGKVFVMMRSLNELRGGLAANRSWNSPHGACFNVDFTTRVRSLCCAAWILCDLSGVVARAPYKEPKMASSHVLVRSSSSSA